MLGPVGELLKRRPTTLHVLKSYVDGSAMPFSAEHVAQPPQHNDHVLNEAEGSTSRRVTLLKEISGALGCQNERKRYRQRRRSRA